MTIFLSKDDLQYDVNGKYIPSVNRYQVNIEAVSDTKNEANHQRKLLELCLTSEELVDLVDGLLDILETCNE